ncbi:MAG: EscU/YscU/HrcU family type III secretion system export apparatus switch protein [Planctomycetota bacterium]|nr:EscU/YscU/HrcU family type III secretion system export apparatus switch protein [Planctomycetota bacterium]
MISQRQIAVALRYLREKDVAPRVTAKGYDHVAAEIVRIAREHSIPIREDADLAQVLVKLDTDRVIPPELYKVMAEVLAWVYSVNGHAVAGAGKAV